MRLISLSLCFLALLAVARADVVHLTTGRSVKGTVVTETDEQVVVKTPQGKLTFPRRLVERIERQSKGATRLALARERAAQGAFEVAIKLYEKAAADSDRQVAKAAREELAALRARLDAKPTPTPTPTPTPGSKPAPTHNRPVPVAGGSGLPPLYGGEFVKTVLAREVVLALREREVKQAQALLDTAQARFAEDASYVYLRARADELGRRPSQAARAYLQLLGNKTDAKSTTPVARLGELARRSLAGPAREDLSSASPGGSDAWKRIETEHFALYHPFPTVEPGFAQVPEAAFDSVLDVLKIKRAEVVFSGRILVFTFKTKDDYDASSGMKLAGGHAQVRSAPDGYLKTITLYAGARQALTTYRHEVAHTVLLELYPDMPLWAHEGAAVYVEAIRERGRYRLAYLGCKAEGTLTDLLSFLRGERKRGADREQVQAYYTQASVIFETLCMLLKSPRKVLALCQSMSDVGPEQALEKVGLTLAEVDAACVKLAKDRKRDR